VRFSQVNFQNDGPAYEVGSWVVCPKCEGTLTRHLFWNQNQERLFTYHCAEHGDVVPLVKESPKTDVVA
jgi:translation initiation factor 2 beta subunit (eIF-2beta)/eIF-5